jgi:hypothetical protein
MIRKLLLAATVATLALTAPVLAQEAKYSIAKQTIGELIANEKTKEVIRKHIPDLLTDPRLERANEMKLADIVQFAPDQLTPEKLKAVEEDLAKLQ